MKRIMWRRVAAMLVPPLAALVAIIYFAEPAGLVGSTRCLPFVGPRVSLDSSLRGSERTLAAAHEAAHATACREQGAIRNYALRLTRAGRLHAELVAFCAEGRAALRIGQRADLIEARILDELEESYPWFRGTPRGEFRRELDLVCPDLAALTRGSS